jgi:hypothetical protein
MNSISRFLFVAMASAFGLCCLGVVAGLIHSLYALHYQHRSLENILGNSIPYYQAVGGLGAAGFLLFLAFLISALSQKKQDKPR